MLKSQLTLDNSLGDLKCNCIHREDTDNKSCSHQKIEKNWPEKQKYQISQSYRSKKTNAKHDDYIFLKGQQIKYREPYLSCFLPTIKICWRMVLVKKSFQNKYNFIKTTFCSYFLLRMIMYSTFFMINFILFKYT